MSIRIKDALRDGAAQVGRHEAAILLAYVTRRSLTALLLHEDEYIPDADKRLFDGLLAVRTAGKPLQYILGQWPFMGLTMTVDERVLIPRPETELLVEAVCHWLAGNYSPMPYTPPRILDMCTGSGCIAIALAHQTGALVTAVDNSPDALALAAENAAANGVRSAIRFVQSDLFTELSAAISNAPENISSGLSDKNLDDGRYDVIVANPPYIPTGDIARLDTAVRDFEPHAALDGGADGLALYRRLIPQSVPFLRPGGALFLEIGPAAGVAALMRQSGYDNIETLRDLAGLDRMVTGIKN